MTGEPAAGPPWRSRLWQGVRLLGLAVRRRPGSFAVAMAGSVLYAATTVATAWVLGRTVDTVVIPAGRDHRVPAALTTAVLLLLAAAALQAVGFAVREAFSARMRFRLQADLRHELFHRYARLPVGWHQGQSTGRLLDTMNADAEIAWQAVRLLPSAGSALIMMAVGLAAMYVTDPLFGWVGLALFVLVILFSLAYELHAGPRVERAQLLRGRLSGVAHESFEAALLVTALGRAAAETDRFAVAAGRLRDANVAAGRVRSLFDPAMEGLPTLGTLVVLAVGAFRVASGDVAPGAVVQVAYLIAVLALPMVSIGWILGEFPLNAAAYRRVAAVLRAPDELPRGKREPVGDGPASVTVTDVAFRHPGAASPALRSVSLTVRPGRMVAVVGPTGSGKSTLAGLLARLADPTAGGIRLDGVDLRDVTRGGLAARVALVPQQPFVFHDTVRANVTLGHPAGDRAVWAALRLARAHGFVRALPNGLGELVGERGHTLSGGQRQRLALARALVRDPGLLVLDDAMSALDPRVEVAILTDLRTLTTRMSIVAISSRLAAVEFADEVAYLEQGEIHDSGAHRELLGRSASYRRLVTAYQRQREPGPVERLAGGPA